MKSSKRQHPSSREIPSLNFQPADSRTFLERGRSLTRSTPTRGKMFGFANALLASHALRPGTGRAPEETGRARHSVRAVVCLARPGAHGVTRPTSLELGAWSFSGCWSLGFGGLR
jgi:hypothetical protein